eukprot:snap_masked-scaffold_8-processed-gene-12.41-mRNA-1 protein AED:0.58 eAED:0.58 QI:0/-1/0/1/-1/1/1/0/249
MEVEKKDIIKENTPFFLPGEDLTPYLPSSISESINIGQGIQLSENSTLYSTLPGYLKFIKPNHVYISPLRTSKRKYFPHLKDLVLGTIYSKSSQSYSININSYTDGTLSSLAFDGATKRSKPALKVGDLVYCRVEDIEFECKLTCEAPEGMIKKDWASGEALFGELKGGTVFEVGVGLSEWFLGKGENILAKVGEKINFEIVVGMNGLIWMKADNEKEMIVLRNVLLNCKGRKGEEVSQMVDRLIKVKI